MYFETKDFWHIDWPTFANITKLGPILQQMVVVLNNKEMCKGGTPRPTAQAEDARGRRHINILAARTIQESVVFIGTLSGEFLGDGWRTSMKAEWQCVSALTQCSWTVKEMSIQILE